jgi:hypothetical protein
MIADGNSAGHMRYTADKCTTIAMLPAGSTCPSLTVQFYPDQFYKPILTGG